MTNTDLSRLDLRFSALKSLTPQTQTVFACAKTRRKAPLKIHFIYLSKKQI